MLWFGTTLEGIADYLEKWKPSRASSPGADQIRWPGNPVAA
jgi:hypothetical protein